MSVYRDFARTDLRSCPQKNRTDVLHDPLLEYEVTMLKLFHTPALVSLKQTHPVRKNRKFVDLDFLRLSKSYDKIQEAIEPERRKQELIVAAHL